MKSKKRRKIATCIWLCLCLLVCTSCYASIPKRAPGEEACRDGIWVCQEVEMYLYNNGTGTLILDGEEEQFCYGYDHLARFLCWDGEEDDAIVDIEGVVGRNDVSDETWLHANIFKSRRKRFVIKKKDDGIDDFGLFDNTDNLTFVLEEEE